MIEVSHIEIAKLELQPGDVLLLRTPPDWTMETRRHAHDAVKEVVDRAGILGVPILVGGTDVEISIIRKDAA